MKVLDSYNQQDLIDQAEENLWEMWSFFGRGPGCALYDEGDTLWWDNPIPIIPYNGVLKFQVEKDIDQRIDTIIDHFKSRSVDFMWFLHPTSNPPDLPERLKGRGLYEIEPMPCMVRDLENLPELPPLPEGMEVREVLEEGDFSEYYNFASWRWGVHDDYREVLGATLRNFGLGKPDTKTHAWQVWQDDVPIAKTAMYISENSAGVYGVATKPEGERQGLATILTLTALNKARKRGKNLAILHSSPMAEKLYQRLGFQTVAVSTLFGSVMTYV